MKIFTVYDQQAEAFLMPFFAPAPGVAIRNFIKSINTPDHQFHQFAADYTLFCIGSYDEHTGFITQDDAHENLGNGLNYLEKDEIPNG